MSLGVGDAKEHDPFASLFPSHTVRRGAAGQLYFLATLVGCIGFVSASHYYGVDVELAAYGAIAVTMLLRVLAIRFNWRTRAFGFPKRP